MGEGAGALILEELDTARARGAEILGRAMPELGYEPFSDELIAFLRERDLYAEGIEDTDQIPDAYVPTAALRKVVASRRAGGEKAGVGGRKVREL